MPSTNVSSKKFLEINLKFNAITQTVANNKIIMRKFSNYSELNMIAFLALMYSNHTLLALICRSLKNSKIFFIKFSLLHIV